MDIRILRRGNARAIAKELGSPKKFADALGKQQNQLSQTIGPNPSRNIGPSLAREMESVRSKPDFWLDKYHQGVKYDFPADVDEAALLQVAEPGGPGYLDLTPAEIIILNMWREWNPAVKQYVFGQMKIVNYTKDVLVGMFGIENTNPITQEQIDELIIESVSEAEKFGQEPGQGKQGSD